MQNSKQTQEGKIEVQLDPEMMKGAYANVTNIGHTKEEFLFDFLFVQQHPAPFGKLVSRVIVHPAHAKRLLLTLQENVRKYEDEHGPIDPGSFPQNSNRTLQ